MAKRTVSAGGRVYAPPHADGGVGALASRPLSVALMLESDGPGGAENMLLQLATALRARGHAVTPVGPSNGCGWLAEQFRGRGFDPATFTLRSPVDWRCARGLARLFRERGIHVVHSHEFTMAVYGAAAARMTGARHVITMHGGTYFADQMRRRVALRWAIRNSAHVVAVSRATCEALERLLGLRRGRVRVVVNGVEFRSGERDRVRRELGVAPDEALVVAVGNLYTVKGHIVLLRALASLSGHRSAERWHVAIAGRGEEESALRDFAAGSGIASRVHLLGFRSDVPDILAAADIYAMPSLSEGLPLALVEAMSAGKAIVASNVGGIPEVITHGRDGVMVPVGDHEMLATELGRLIARPELRRSLGDAAREHARAHFGVDAMADAYERLYTSNAREPARG